jgi:hypothetical protein
LRARSGTSWNIADADAGFRRAPAVKVLEQLDEFYLTAMKSVDPGLREKYAKIYRNH